MLRVDVPGPPFVRPTMMSYEFRKFLKPMIVLIRT
jgi:hypothetical protein